MRRVFAPRGLRLLHATRMRNIHTLPFAGGAATSLPHSRRHRRRRRRLASCPDSCRTSQCAIFSWLHILFAHLFAYFLTRQQSCLPTCPLYPFIPLWPAASAATCLCLLLPSCTAIQLSRSCISLLSVCLSSLCLCLCLSLSASLSVFVFGFSCLPPGLIVHLVCIFMKSLCGLCNKFNSSLFMCHPRDIYHSIWRRNWAQSDSRKSPLTPPPPCAPPTFTEAARTCWQLCGIFYISICTVVAPSPCPTPSPSVAPCRLLFDCLLMDASEMCRMCGMWGMCDLVKRTDQIWKCPPWDTALFSLSLHSIVLSAGIEVFTLLLALYAAFPWTLQSS